MKITCELIKNPGTLKGISISVAVEDKNIYTVLPVYFDEEDLTLPAIKILEKVKICIELLNEKINFKNDAL